MTEFNPPHNWMWAGPILGLTVSYDHKFEALDAEQTRLTWTVAAEGRGASVLGRMYAGFYRGNMERAIVQLIREMNSSAASV